MQPQGSARMRPMVDRRLPAVAAVLCALPACWSPAWHRERADDRALAIIEETYRRALDRDVAFSIDSPATDLRRKLIEELGLPVSGPASLGSTELPPIDHWPEDLSPKGPFEAFSDPALDRSRAAGAPAIELTLADALRIAAANSNSYQDSKEAVFRAALALDLARNEFRTTFTGLLEGSLSSELMDDPRTRTTGLEGTGSLSAARRFQNGVALSSLIGLDVVKLLTGARNRSMALFWDSSITIPLMRGASRHVVAEPMIQAERDTLYAILEFERFKRTFAVQIATRYLEVLRQIDQVNNAEQNYKSLIASARQLRRLAETGKRPGLEADQAVQDELRARDSWVSAVQSYLRQLDTLRTDLGLPPDAEIQLDRSELAKLGASVRRVLGVAELVPPEAPADPAAAAAEEAEARGDDGLELGADAPIVLVPPGFGDPGPLEIAPGVAAQIGLDERLDLAVAQGRVYDAQRAVTVAADALRAEVTLLGSSSLGQRRSLGDAALPDSTHLNYNDDARYEAILSLDLPFERTAERNAYRASLIDLERAVRELQDLEDQVKREVRDQIRNLLEAREAQRTQSSAVALAAKRVDSTRMNLDAGRAQTRDLLEAQEDLVSAQNDLTAALISYRIAELELLRDLGLLEVTEEGLWRPIDHPQLQFRPDA